MPSRQDRDGDRDGERDRDGASQHCPEPPRFSPPGPVAQSPGRAQASRRRHPRERPAPGEAGGNPETERGRGQRSEPPRRRFRCRPEPAERRAQLRGDGARSPAGVRSGRPPSELGQGGDSGSRGGNTGSTGYDTGNPQSAIWAAPARSATRRRRSPVRPARPGLCLHPSLFSFPPSPPAAGVFPSQVFLSPLIAGRAPFPCSPGIPAERRRLLRSAPESARGGFPGGPAEPPPPSRPGAGGSRFPSSAPLQTRHQPVLLVSISNCCRGLAAPFQDFG